MVLLLAMLRIVNSPFGRVLQAIRENEFRAEAIGYRVVVYRTTSSILSALFATLAGAMLAIWLRYNGPDTSLSFEIMLDVLLIVVIGGMGTIYGAAIGSGVFVVAQSYLQDLLKLASDAASGLPWLSALLSPDRWLLWLGLLFVLSVYYFPTGIVGRLRALRSAPREFFPAPHEETALNKKTVTDAVRAPSIRVDLGVAAMALAGCGGGGRYAQRQPQLRRRLQCRPVALTNSLPRDHPAFGDDHAPPPSTDGAGTTAATQDLLTGGIGKTGLGAAAAPAYVDPLNPTALELRRNALYSNYRGIVDPTPAAATARSTAPTSTPTAPSPPTKA